MFTYLEEVSVTEGEQIKKTIQALFRQTCILQVKYDPATLAPRDNAQYETCARHRSFIEDYVSVLGCELIHDSQEHIFRLTGDADREIKPDRHADPSCDEAYLQGQDHGRGSERTCDNAEGNA